MAPELAYITQRDMETVLTKLLYSSRVAVGAKALTDRVSLRHVTIDQTPTLAPQILTSLTTLILMSISKLIIPSMENQ